MINWISANITKFRPTGTIGNNFSLRKRSHGPLGSKESYENKMSLGGFGERKFSGYTTKNSFIRPTNT